MPQRHLSLLCMSGTLGTTGSILIETGKIWNIVRSQLERDFGGGDAGQGLNWDLLNLPALTQLNKKTT
jgi:hypothetical protein